MHSQLLRQTQYRFWESVHVGLGDDGASAFAQSGRLALICGMLIIWPLIVVMAILVKEKVPDSPTSFYQKRVDKDGTLFTYHKFWTMLVKKYKTRRNMKYLKVIWQLTLSSLLTLGNIQKHFCHFARLFATFVSYLFWPQKTDKIRYGQCE